ncbi:MAG: orotate phosphoribosyltransferase [Tissierellia bacterium]|nr:orotate phosphoribosyltransferase [Tissierellia bacterium]
MKNIAEALLDLKAVILRPQEPFTWASGILSPIYCDNRLTLSYPKERTLIINGFCDLITDKYPDTEMIMGTATAGIPHAAIIADRLNLPMGYVRSKTKDHGRQNQIEGAIYNGVKVILIEDLISTGISSINAAKALIDAGCEVLAVVSIFNYELKDSIIAFNESGIPFYSLTNYTELIDVAVKRNYVEKSMLNKLMQWKLNPHNQAWIGE